MVAWVSKCAVLVCSPIAILSRTLPLSFSVLLSLSLLFDLTTNKNKSLIPTQPPFKVFRRRERGEQKKVDQILTPRSPYVDDLQKHENIKKRKRGEMYT